MSGSVAINPETGDIQVLGSEGQWAPAQRARNPETGAEVYYDGRGWQPVPRAADPNVRAGRQANSGVGGYIDSLARQFAQGATFGTADEISAGLNTGAGLWGDYGQSLAAERGRDEAFRTDNPITAGVANFAGAVLGPGRSVGMIAPANPGAGLAARLLRSGLGRGAVAGATGGAAAGAGEGEGVQGRATAALTGGTVGGVLGGALGGGVSAGSTLAGRLLHGLGLRNPEVAADRQLLRALERDSRPVAGLSVPEGLTITDVGGANVRNLAGAAANSPGRAMEVADELVQARRAARPERIAGAVDDAFGGGGGTRVADEVAALRTQRATDAAPLYDEAFRQPTGMTEALRVLVDDPIGQAGLARGLNIQRIEEATAGRRPGNMLGMDPAVQFAEDGTPRIVGEPSTRTLDSIKRGIDDTLEGYRDPVTGRLNLDERGRAIEGFRQRLVELLDQGNPSYAQARAAWAGPTQSTAAMGQGQAALRANPDQVAQIAARLSPGDLEFFRLGVGRAITDMGADPARGATAARRLLEDRNMQRRLEAAIPDPAQRQAFAQAMQREVDMATVDRAISPRAGSQTARLQAGQDDMQIDAPGGLAGALISGTSLGGAIRQGVNSVYRRAQGMTPATADSLAARLMSDDAAQNAATVQRLIARSRADQLTEREKASLAAQLLRGIGTTTSLELNDR